MPGRHYISERRNIAGSMIAAAFVVVQTQMGTSFIDLDHVAAMWPG